MYIEIVSSLVFYQNPIILQYYYSLNSHNYEMNNGELKINGYNLNNIPSGSYIGNILFSDI